MKNLIIQEAGKEAYSFISKHIKFCSGKALVLSTTTQFNVDNQPDNTYSFIVNLKKVNNIRRINKFIEAVNAKLPMEGIFVCSVETYGLRKKRIFNKYPWLINYIIYFFDCIF